MTSPIVPIILAGGGGTRLWPVSRKSFPKQFSPLIGEHSLFQQSASRVATPDYDKPIVMTNGDFRFIVAEQLVECGIDPMAVMIEPSIRNTAPAILAAALYVAESDPEQLMLVMPSDHVIRDEAAFRAAVEASRDTAMQGRIITFGIQPLHAETGYGYLEVEAALPDGPAAAPVALSRFVEKPDLERAQAMVATGRHLWNAGIFLFKASSMIAAFEAHAPQYLDPVRDALSNATVDLGFLRLDPDSWSASESNSIDYAVLEHSNSLAAMPYKGDWSDLGDWSAVWREKGGVTSDDGVVVDAQSTAIGCTNTLLQSASVNQEVVGVGLDNISVVATPDAVLVCDMSNTQKVGMAVKALKEKGVKQATAFPRDHRPWGEFETLALSDRFQVKRIVVKPGESLSLQSHMHRSEHWIVVAGTALVRVDDDERLLTENQSIYIPLGAVHRLTNPGKVPMVLIEIQTGAYLGEDDIIRYEDVYARS